MNDGKVDQKVYWPRIGVPFWSDLRSSSNENGHRAMAHGQRTFLAIAQEMTRFLQTRVEEDCKTWAKLRDCGSPEEFIGVQQLFATTATEQYLQEMLRLVEIMTEAARTSSVAANDR